MSYVCMTYKPEKEACMFKTQFSIVKVYLQIIGELMEISSYDENTHLYKRLELWK